MASSRRTATNENVSTYGVARDYSSLATWESATDIDLVSAAQSEVLECYDDAASFNDLINMSGATTNSSYFRIIRPAGVKGEASWQGHDGTPNNGVYFHNQSNGNEGFILNEDYATIQDLIHTTTWSGSGNGPAILGGENSRCVGIIEIDCHSSDSDLRGFEMYAGSFCVNCIAINGDDEQFLADADAMHFLNCTAIGKSSAQDGFDEFSTDPTWINCLSTGHTNKDFDGGAGLLEQNNASGDGTASGTGSRINQTFAFVNAAGNDYNLASTDAGARNYGQNLSAYGPYPFDDDINWRTRPGESVWDIGASEYVPDSGPDLTDINGILAANINDINTVDFADISDVNGVG